VKNEPNDEYTEEENSTATATRNASANTLRRRPNAKNGDVASILATAPKSRRKSARSPYRKIVTIIVVIPSLRIAELLSGRSFANAMRTGHITSATALPQTHSWHSRAVLRGHATVRARARSGVR